MQYSTEMYIHNQCQKNFLKPPKFDFRESWNWIVLWAGKKVCWLTMHVGMQGLQFRLHKWPKTTRISLYGVANWSSHPPEERRLGFESRHGVRLLKGKRSNAVVYAQWHNVHWCMYGLKWEIKALDKFVYINTQMREELARWCQSVWYLWSIFTKSNKNCTRDKKAGKIIQNIFHGRLELRVARFFLVQTYQNVNNIPNEHKLYRTAINYTKWQKNIPNGQKL
jgi:hypothetical protein